MFSWIRGALGGVVSKLPWIGGAAIVGAGAAAGSGPDGWFAKLGENAASALKNVDAITDVDDFFTRIMRFFQNCVKAFRNFGDIVNGRVNINTFFSDENDKISNPDAAAPATKLGQDVANELGNGNVGNTLGQGVDIAVNNPVKTGLATAGLGALAYMGYQNSKATKLSTQLAGIAADATARATAGGASKMAAQEAGEAAINAFKNAAAPAARGGLTGLVTKLPGPLKLVAAAAVVGGAYGAAQNLDDVVPADPNAPVSIMDNPGGFVNSLATGLSDLQSLEKWTDGTNFSSSVNLQKSATLGALTGAGWLVGQAVDMGSWALNTTGLDQAIGMTNDQNVDYSENWSQTVSDYTVSGMDNFLGGAPDLSGAWAQTAHFGGSLIPGGVGAKGVSLTTKLLNAFRTASVGNVPIETGRRMSQTFVPAGP